MMKTYLYRSIIGILSLNLPEKVTCHSIPNGAISDEPDNAHDGVAGEQYEKGHQVDVKIALVELQSTDTADYLSKQIKGKEN